MIAVDAFITTGFHEGHDFVEIDRFWQEKTVFVLVFAKEHRQRIILLVRSLLQSETYLNKLLLLFEQLFLIMSRIIGSGYSEWSICHHHRLFQKPVNSRIKYL